MLYDQRRGRYFPPRGSFEVDLLDYRDRIINRWSAYRNSHMGRIALSMWYFLGRQWAEFDYEAAFDGIRGSILRDMDNSDLPRPVTNVIDPAVEQEVIALVKRQWTPKITPTSNDPRIKAAAQVAQDVLNYRLEQLFWREKRHQLGLHFAVGGTGLIYTAWDKSYSELKTIGAPSAVWCRACEGKLYSREVPVESLRAGVEGQPAAFSSAAKPVLPVEGEDTVERAELSHCPTCDDIPQPLEPYEPTEDEALRSDDIFGRPLGILEPRGQSMLEVDLPFEFYPENAGYRIQPDTLRCWGRRKIRSLEWVEEHYPHLVDKIEPDPISELVYDDPLLGEWNVLGNWSAAYDSGILDHHVNVDEVVKLPTFRYPLGRYIVCTKDVVLEDSDLLEPQLVDGEELLVARVQMSASRFKLRPGEFWGTTISDHVISPQNRLNGIDAQVIETRLRMGSPNLFMTPGMWVDDPVRFHSQYGLGKIYMFKPDPEHPEMLHPEVFGGVTMPQDVYVERQNTLEDAKRAIGPNDSAAGNPVKNVGTTSGMQFLVDQDERSRSLREDELVGSGEKSFSHLLQLQWVLRVDEDSYRVLGPNKTWSLEQYRGSALRGQTEVKVERGSFIGRSIVERESAREAIADGAVIMDNPVTRRKMAAKYGMETDLNEDSSVQVDDAERQWSDFVEHGKVAVQDDLDEPIIHHIVLGTHLKTEQGRQLALDAGWEDIQRAIAGWQDELVRMTVLEQASIAFYGGRLDGEEAEDAFAQAEAKHDQSLALYEQEQQHLQDAQVPGVTPPLGPTGEPPAPPPPPSGALGLPILMQDRILTIWLGMLQRQGIVLQPTPEMQMGLEEDTITGTMNYLKFRALDAAYLMSVPGALPQMPPPGMMGPAVGTGGTMAPVDKGGPMGPAPGPGGGGGQAGGQPGNPPKPANVKPMPEGGKR